MGKKGHIEALTLFEIMIVLSIMGLLITIISLSLNRFNEQMKFTSEVQQELNRWYQFRSNLWKELYHADSLELNSGELSIYGNNNVVSYKVDEDSVYRKGTEDWKSTGFLAESIRMEEQSGDRLFAFDFLWKGDVMTLSYLDHATPKMKIDRYFEAL